MSVLHRILDPRRGDQVPSGLCALAVMTKAPRAGRVKTRLTPPLTPEEAATLNTCFLRDTGLAISETTMNGSALGIGVFTPLGAEAAYAGILPAEFYLMPQRGETFGEKLHRATDDLLRLGFSSVCLIDSDSPTVPQQVFRDAVQLLSRPEDSIVLGPSDDGGYYLLGLKKLHRGLFETIDWSTERVFQQTIEAADKIGVQRHLLPTWYDVDDQATLARLCAELFGGNGRRGPGFAAPATRRFLSGLLEREGRARIWPNDFYP